MEILLFASGALVLYHYAIYPGIVLLLAKLIPRRGMTPDGNASWHWPAVTLLIAAYNEERVIEEKLRNSLALEYPGSLEIVVVMDGSNDGTVSVVERYADRGVVSLYRPERRGKTAALNRGVAVAKGDIIIFSDANNEFGRDAVQLLVRNFDDVTVGGVCGVKSIRGNVERESSIGDGMYWRYESAIKLAESRIGTITNADGEIFAMRRELYRPIDERIINDDAQITFDIVRQGCRVLYEPAARATESASIRIEDDFHVKVRMVAGGFQSIAANWRLFLPPRSWFAVAYLSHKALRYVIPLLLIAFFISSAALSAQPLYLTLFGAQTVFYLLAVAGFRQLRRGSRNRFLYVPFYFSAMNLAALFGLARFVMGRQNTSWRKAQR